MGARDQPQVAPEGACPTSGRRVIEIREADPAVDKAHHDQMRSCLIDAVAVPNTTVLLGPNVVLAFSDAPDTDIPLSFASCVTLMSVSSFPPVAFPTSSCDEPTIVRKPSPPPAGAAELQTRFAPQSARTPHSLGPLLKFGPTRKRIKSPKDIFFPPDYEKVFLDVRTIGGFAANDNVRISGFRLHGPSFGQQHTDEIGILITRSLNVEVSNMEIAGWGGQGIQVVDDPADGPGQESPNNREGERIGRPEQVRIFNNYIHHNQHPRTAFNSHTAGYGVETNHGSWAQIYENVFDFNRHAIAAAGDAGGYEAHRNLVLKGGGIHYDGAVTFHTHEFDIHGTGDNGFGGRASVQTWYSHNSFQYLNDNAIKIRGRPALRIFIGDNIFAHEGLEDDWGDDAIAVDDRDDLDVIEIKSGNTIDFDSYGKYGVGDFDGDGIDDLFLATGRTWWFSSFGEFPWSYLSLRNERLSQLRLGYFDADLRCDLLTESGGAWVISSGGTGPWVSLGAFGVPLSEVVFGRFDPDIRDHRPEATRRTTHAFRRASDGQWFVTPLTVADWRPVQSSSFPLSKLRFGDFTGDGVTDVLAVEGGRWAISESARSGWKTLNPHLSDDVRSLFFADLDHDNIDDIIKLEKTSVGLASRLTWWVSESGRSRWRKLKTYNVLGSTTVGFAGRFGAAPGGAVLLIDPARIGHFFSEAERAVGASPDWNSLFKY
jgi:hypothetical protein